MLTAARPRCSTLLVALMNALWVPYWKVITDKTLSIARREGGASQQADVFDTMACNLE